MTFYAVARGRKTGIFNNWSDCNSSIYLYKNPIYRKFSSQLEAEEYLQKASSCTEPSLDHIFDYYVYTDGACIHNGKPNANASIGIYFAEGDVRNVSEKVMGKQSNNVAELTAIIKAYSIIENDIKEGKNICIVTDSEYALKCINNYGKKMANKNWSEDIPNKELVKQIYECFFDKKNVQFMHINSHTNNTDIHSIGNSWADKLANQALSLSPFHKISNEKAIKIYLCVPYESKDEAKSLGCMWDFKKKLWYLFDNNPNKDKLFKLFDKF